MEPLQQELHDTKQQLEASKALESSADEELAKVKQEHQTSEMALQNEIEKHKAEIELLQTEAEASLRQNTHSQTEIQRLESEIGVLSAQNARQETTIEALRESHSQQAVQHDTDVEAMIAEKKSLSDRNDKQAAEIVVLESTLKEIEETLSRDNERLQAQVDNIQADKDTLDIQVIQVESLNRALQAEKDALSTRNNRQAARINTLDVERGDLMGQISQLEFRIHDLEMEKGGLIDRNGEYEQRIQALNKDHQETIERLEASRSILADQVFELQQEQANFLDAHEDEVHRLKKDNDAFKDQVRNLQRDLSSLSIRDGQKQIQIKDLEANVQRLVKQRDDQSNQKRQHLDEISQLKTDLESRENTLQGKINHADEERTLARQEIQQLQHFLFSKLLSIQNDQIISLPAGSATRLLFKRQQLSTSHDNLPQWIQGPLKETLETLTNSDDTSNLAEMYPLVLGSLTCLQSSSNIEDKGSLLECMRKFQTWLTKACKDRTSILGLALAHAIKLIQEGPQSDFDSWFSTNQFHASRVIDSRNSELPETTSVIADGFSGIVLLLQGTDIQVCEATDISMREQTSCGMQLVFNEALNLPDFQLLADSWPHMDRWEPLTVWAVEVGRFNLVKKSGRVYKAEEFKEA